MTQNKSLEFWNRRQQLLSSKALGCISILLCLWSAGGSTSRNYSEIVKLGSSCPMLDSCAYQRTIASRKQQITERNCNCDPSCSEYGDCCIDAVAPTTPGSGRNDLTCLHVEQSGGVFMRDSCPPTFTGYEAVKNLCERTKLGDQVDPLASLPVTDLLSGLTYKNFYCNLCSNSHANDIVMWTPKLECPLLSLLNMSGSITPAYVLENLSSDGRGWGLYLNDESSDGEEFFHDCNVQPVMPSRLQQIVRPCTADLVSDCPPSWSGEEVKRMCKSYTGTRFDVEGRSYRNAHCAICNGVNASRLSCRPVEEVDIFRDFGTHSFALLLDVSEATGEEVGRMRLCKRGEVFDPFFKKCRSVSCLPGFVRRGKRCVMRNPMEFVRFYTGSSRKATTTSTTSNYRGGIDVTIGSKSFHSTLAYVNATFPNA